MCSSFSRLTLETVFNVKFQSEKVISCVLGRNTAARNYAKKHNILISWKTAFLLTLFVSMTRSDMGQA